MKKKTILIVALSFGGSIVFMIVLFFLSGIIIQSRNAFLRVFAPHPILERDTIDVRYNSYYIAGVSSKHTYLGNHMAPNRVLIIGENRKDTLHRTIQLPNGIEFKSMRIQVDSPYFYVLDGMTPAILRGNVQNWSGSKISGSGNAYFNDLQVNSRNSFFIRSLSSQNEQYVLGKETFREGQSQLTLKHDLLKKQIDGKFCVDGIMDYNSDLGRVIYTYYYRNQFLVMDTMLNLIYEGRTIDTVSRAKIKITEFSNGTKQMMGAPPLMVNKRMCTDGNWLLIHSGLLAKNEDVNDFKHSSVIDVYHLNDGSYQFSFYIRDFKTEKLRFFSVNEGQLVALFERHIILYDITPKYLQMKDRF